MARGPGGKDRYDEDHEREGGHGRAQDNEGELSGLHPAKPLVQLKHILEHAQCEVDASGNIQFHYYEV